MKDYRLFLPRFKRTSMTTTLIILSYLFFPLFILYLCHKIGVANKLGPVVLAYVFGIIAGNIGIFNEEEKKVLEYISMGSIPLALPMILFSSNLKNWIKLAPKAFISMTLGILSVLVTVFIGFKLFHNSIPDTWKISGMLVGVYSGGTPNMAAIKTALDVSDEIYIITNTYDVLVSSLFLLFVITIGKTLLSYILPSFNFKNDNQLAEEVDYNGKELFWGLHKRRYTRGLLVIFLISLFIVGLSYLIGMSFNQNIQMAIIILSITTFGILFSFVKKVKQIEKSFELGMYFIVIFSLAVSSLADIRQLINISPYLLLYVLIAVFGTLILHVLLSKFFKIDTDTVIVSSTALICAPPFVPVVAGALGNKEVVLSGIAVGVIGYAIGNYIGIAYAFFLHSLV